MFTEMNWNNKFSQSVNNSVWEFTGDNLHNQQLGIIKLTFDTKVAPGSW